MQRILFGTIISLFTIPGFAQEITPPTSSSVDLLLKQTCGSIISLTENRMAEARTKLAEIESAKAKLKVDFVYPQATLAGLGFQVGAPKIYEMLSAETVALANKYNLVFRQIDLATNIPASMRPEMKRQLQSTYGDQLAALITRDLGSSLNGVRTMQNGNRIEDTSMSWGIYYAPTGEIPALAIRQLFQIRNFESPAQTGKAIDPLKTVSLTVEMHYYPETKSFTHLPASTAAAEVEPMFVRTTAQLQSGYFFFTDDLEQTAKSQLEYASKDASYQECKKLKP